MGRYMELRVRNVVRVCDVPYQENQSLVPHLGINSAFSFFSVFRVYGQAYSSLGLWVSEAKLHFGPDKPQGNPCHSSHGIWISRVKSQRR